MIMQLSERQRHPPQQSASEALVEAVATERGEDPTTLEPPLHDLVDPDALDALFRGRESVPPFPDGHVAFTMAGCRVVVHSTGEIDVTPLGAEGAVRP